MNKNIKDRPSTSVNPYLEEPEEEDSSEWKGDPDSLVLQFVQELAVDLNKARFSNQPFHFPRYRHQYPGLCERP